MTRLVGGMWVLALITTFSSGCDRSSRDEATWRVASSSDQEARASASEGSVFRAGYYQLMHEGREARGFSWDTSTLVEFRHGRAVYEARCSLNHREESLVTLTCYDADGDERVFPFELMERGRLVHRAEPQFVYEWRPTNPHDADGSDSEPRVAEESEPR